MQRSSVNITALLDYVHNTWNTSETVRIIILVLTIYYLGYFQANYLIVGIVGYALFQFHYAEVAFFKSQLEAKYIHYDKDPDLIRHLVGSIPKWVQFGEWEKCRFLNNMIEIFWPFMRQAMAESIRQNLTQVLQDSKPPFIAKLAFGVIELGQHPIKIKGIKVLSKEKTIDEVFLDLDIDLRGGDATIGVIAKSIHISLNAQLKHIEMRGTLRIVFSRLSNEWPLFNSVRIAFTKQPILSYKLKAVKVPLNHIPGFVPWFNDFIRDSLKDWLIWPNETVIHLDDAGNSMTASQPKGILRVRIIEAKNLQKRDLFGKSDPMVTVWTRHFKESTRKLNSTLNPKWDDAMFEFILYDKQREKLHVEVWNVHFHRKNEKNGEVHIDLSQLKNKTYSTEWYTLNNCESGKIHIELFYTPFVRKENKSKSDDALSKDAKSTFMNELYSESDVHSEARSDNLAKRRGNPKPKNIMSKSMSILGTESSSFDLEREETLTLQRLPKVESVPNLDKVPITPTKLERFSNSFKKMKLKQLKIVNKLSPHIETQSRAPFDALLRVKIISGKDLKGVNRNGYSDPYVVIRINDDKLNQQRTSVKKKTNNPVWNEAVEFRVSTEDIATGILYVTVKDRDKWAKNRGIGSLQFSIKDLMQNDADVLTKDYQLQNTATGSLLIETQLLSIYRTSELQRKHSKRKKRGSF